MDKMKTRLIATYAFLLMGLAAYADLHPVVNDKGKWGFADDEGKIVMKHKFDAASDFNVFGLAEVTQGDKHGFIGRDFKFVIPCKYKYVGSFNSDGVVWVNEGGRIAKGDSRVTGGKFYLLRSDGTPFIEGGYAGVGYFIPWKSSYTSAQLEKMTVTERSLTEGAQHSYWRKRALNLTPGMMLPTNVEAYLLSKRDDCHCNGVYATDGTEIIPVGKYWFANCPVNGISIVRSQGGNGQYNFLHVSTGQHLLSSDIDDSWGFADGHCLGKSGGLWYVYGEDGQKKSAGYTMIYPANNGVHVVRNGSDRYGLIAFDGREVLPAENYSVYPCIEGLSLVRKTSSSKIGYVDKDGHYVIPAETYQSGFSFSNGTALVKHGKWGMIDRQGNVLIPFIYYSMKTGTDADRCLYWGKRESNSLWEVYDTSTGEVVIPPSYFDVWLFDTSHEGLALVRKTSDENSYGWIDKSGAVVVPCRYSNAMAVKAGEEYVNSGRSPWTDYKHMMFTLRNEPFVVPLAGKADESKWDY